MRGRTFATFGWVAVLVAMSGFARGDGLRQENLDEAFDLNLGEAVAVAMTALCLRFSEVVNDSRCPPGMRCVWAGNAEIRVDALREGEAEPTALFLNSAGFGENVNQRTVAGYRIRLEQLTAASPERPPGEGYTATLRVSAVP